MVDKTPLRGLLAAAKYGTRLEAFLKSHGIRPAHFAREACVSRQHILRLRLGTMEPTRRMMVILTGAARRIMRRRVEVSELFDLEVR